MTESQLYPKFLKELNKHGWFYHAADKFQAGVPDILGHYNGIFIALELKIIPNTLTNLQLYVAQQIITTHGLFFSCTFKPQTRTNLTRYIGYCFNNDTRYETQDIKAVTAWVLSQSLLFINKTSSNV